LPDFFVCKPVKMHKLCIEFRPYVGFLINTPMKKILHLSAFFLALTMMGSALCQAGHPLIQNGWLKAASDTTITILLPPVGKDEATFTFAPNVKISFEGSNGTPADLQSMAASMGKTRILLNLRRDKPDSSTVVIVVIKAQKPVAQPTLADGSQPTPEAPLAPEAAGSSAE
jgi:hypothetical protein